MTSFNQPPRPRPLPQETSQAQTATGAFLRSVLCVRNNSFDAAREHIDRARELMGTDLAALVGEWAARVCFVLLVFGRRGGGIVPVDPLNVLSWRG